MTRRVFVRAYPPALVRPSQSTLIEYLREEKSNIVGSQISKQSALRVWGEPNKLQSNLRGTTSRSPRSLVEVENDVPIRQTARQREVIAFTSLSAVPGRESSLTKADGDLFEVRRHNQTTGAGENTKSALVDELRANVGHVREECCFVQGLGNR